MTHEISARQLEWLRGELAAWQDDGLVDADTARAVLARYRGGRRGSVVRLISVIGSAFVGVGLISLVASNLDQFSPLVRFAGITAVWLGAVVVAELLLRRDPTADDGRGSLGVGAARVVAVAAYAGTVFQAAQSLQVPAYASGLLGCVAGGALAYAYACRGIGPLLVGIAAAVGWYGWAVGEQAESGGAVVLALVVAGVIATALAGLHDGTALTHFSPPWAYAASVLLLVGLFAAALPITGAEGPGGARTAGGLAVAALVAAATAVSRGGQVRRETAAAVGIAAAALLLVAWHPESGTDNTLSGAELLHAVVGTVLYLAAAVWTAVVGAIRERPQLTNLATAALVVFVTVQSFGVFAPLLSGAALFLVLGIVLIAAGAVADRGRRRIIEEVAE